MQTGIQITHDAKAPHKTRLATVSVQLSVGCGMSQNGTSAINPGLAPRNGLAMVELSSKPVVISGTRKLAPLNGMNNIQ